MDFALPLSQVKRDDRVRVGGKAAGCAALLRIGMRVPEGAVLTTDAFDHFLRDGGFDLLREELLQAFRGGNPESRLEERCRVLQAAVRSARIPSEISDALLRALRGVPSPWAVRSSATVEDGEGTAFAGVFRTTLDVGEDGLFRAVKECWAEAFSYAAITHALRNGQDPRSLLMAVLVQEQVRAEWSGVLFTQAPGGAAPECAEVVFTRGIGERLMQGTDSGTRLRFERATGAVRVAASGETLPPDLFRSLAALGRKIERKFGRPQDVEWAAAGGRIFLLQARPISPPEVDRSDGVLWTRHEAEERFPHPVSPLGWSVLEPVIRSNLETLSRRFRLASHDPRDVVRSIRHYLYVNRRFFDLPGSIRPKASLHLRLIPRYLATLGGILKRAPGLLFSRGRFGLRWLAVGRLCRQILFPYADEIRRSWETECPGILREIETFEAVDLRALSDRELLQVRARFEETGFRFMEPDLPILAVKTACERMLGRIGEEILERADPGFVAELTAGVVENRTLRMNDEMKELYETLGALPGVRQMLKEERYGEVQASLEGGTAATWRAFLSRNGHLTTNFDVLAPTWGEAPEQVLYFLRPYVLAEEGRSFRDGLWTRLERFRAARADVMRALRGVPWMESFFDRLLCTLHEFMRIDEEHHFYCSRFYPFARRMYAEIGARLSESGALPGPEDVYFLTLSEIVGSLEDSRPLPRRYQIEARRAAFARSFTVAPPREYRDGIPVRDEPAASGRVFQGTGASPGAAIGRVRIVERPEDVSLLEPGEVLVTASPNPAWTPAYAVAGALVSACGNPLSHGLVSAREYGLPAVVGIADVARKLATGQRVRVDGDAGSVIVLTEASDARPAEVELQEVAS